MKRERGAPSQWGTLPASRYFGETFRHGSPAHYDANCSTATNASWSAGSLASNDAFDDRNDFLSVHLLVDLLFESRHRAPDLLELAAVLDDDGLDELELLAQEAHLPLDVSESMVHLLESAVHLLESAVHLLESRGDVVAKRPERFSEHLEL
jgi:hypothetical protein